MAANGPALHALICTLPASAPRLGAQNYIWPSDLLCLVHTVFFKNVSQHLKIRSFSVKPRCVSSLLRMEALATQDPMLPRKPSAGEN